VILEAGNSYNYTYADAGTLEAAVVGALPNNANVDVNGGNLKLDASNNVGTGTVTLDVNGGSITTTNSSTLTASSFTLASNSVNTSTISANLAGAGGLNMSGTESSASPDRTPTRAPPSFLGHPFGGFHQCVAHPGTVNVSGTGTLLVNFNSTIATVNLNGGVIGGSASLTASAAYNFYSGTVSALLSGGANAQVNINPAARAAGHGHIEQRHNTYTGAPTSTPARWT